MKPKTVLLVLAVTLGLTGCNGGPSASSAPAPLSAADWKALPADQKYTPETLERLKAGDPSLQTPEGWEAFQKSVVGPARKKDFPGGKAKP